MLSQMKSLLAKAEKNSEYQAHFSAAYRSPFVGYLLIQIK